MALTAPKLRVIQEPNLIVRRLIVVDTGETLYQGAIVSNSGTGAEAAQIANPCIGIALDTYTAGQTAILEYNQVELFVLSTTPDAGDIGSTVYAVDDENVTLSSTSNSCIVGVIVALGGSENPADSVYVQVTCRA